MQYRKDKKGQALSVLGYGCMRFSKKGSAIDIDKTEKEIMAAIDAGVNYFDTAYIYGGSEAALGQILERTGSRDKVNIATKLPHFMLKSVERAEKLFQEELKRLRTDHVDYYLMHMLTDIQTWEGLKGLGIQKWIAQKLESGAIRNIGFSYHGSTDMFKQLIDAYPWDFCQIQYNYMDEHSQAGRSGLEYAGAKGIPVIIMEPLRGGNLTDKLPQAAKQLFIDDNGGRTAAEMAFKWLYDQPQVTCVLSGMSSLEMVNENVKIASESLAMGLGEEDRVLIEKVKQIIKQNTKVGCTACGYCMPCPKGVDIPGTFQCYNTIYAEGRKSARMEYLRCTAMRKNPSSASCCTNCGKCETHCPQHIAIRQALGAAAKELEGFTYKGFRGVVKLFRLFG